MAAPALPGRVFLRSCLLLGSVVLAHAAAGDSFLGDLVSATASPINSGTYKDTVRMAGTATKWWQPLRGAEGYVDRAVL
jgi:hypothetical protein